MKADAACPACNKSDVRFNFSLSAAQSAQAIVLPTGDCDRNRRLQAHIDAPWGADAEFCILANSDVSYPSVKWEFRRTNAALKAKLTASDLKDV